jgi:DNA-binding protein H-NS
MLTELRTLSLDELSELYEEIGTILAEKINLEKRRLEERLAKLSRNAVRNPRGHDADGRASGRRSERRKYPPVLPKFRNPANPSETWAGRGKQPRWLVSQLRGGKKIEDFLIERTKRSSKGRPRSA